MSTPNDRDASAPSESTDAGGFGGSFVTSAAFGGFSVSAFEGSFAQSSATAAFDATSGFAPVPETSPTAASDLDAHAASSAAPGAGLSLTAEPTATFGRVKSGRQRPAEQDLQKEMDEFSALAPLQKCSYIRKHVCDAMFFNRTRNAGALCRHVLAMLQQSDDVVLLIKASRLTLDLALGSSDVLDELVPEGLLPAICKALQSLNALADESQPGVGARRRLAMSGASAHLLHALCRLVKDSQDAVTAMADVGCGVAEAVGLALGAAVQAWKAAPPAAAADGDAGADAEDGDDEKEGEADEDPIAEGTDLCAEIFERLVDVSDSSPEIVQYWGNHVLGPLVEVLQHADHGPNAMRCVLNILACEVDKAGGPWHARALKPLAAAIASKLSSDDPDDLFGDQPLRVASALARKGDVGVDAIVQAGIPSQLPRWLVSTRPEIACAACQVVGSCLLAGPSAALKLVSADPSLPAAISQAFMVVYRADAGGEEEEEDVEDCEPLVRRDGGAGSSETTAVPQSKQSKRSKKRKGGFAESSNHLWHWDGHMYIITGLSASLEAAAAAAGLGAGSEPAPLVAAADPSVASLAGSSLTAVLVAGGLTAALATIIDQGSSPSGGIGRHHNLLIRHAAAALVSMMVLAPEATRKAATEQQPVLSDVISRLLDDDANFGSRIHPTGLSATDLSFGRLFARMKTPHAAADIKGLLVKLREQLATEG